MAVKSYLLDLEENWFVREHPYNRHAVKVRRLCREVEALEEQLEAKRAQLTEAVVTMREHMKL